jgi:hypothetical protein
MTSIKETRPDQSRASARTCFEWHQDAPDTGKGVAKVVLVTYLDPQNRRLALRYDRLGFIIQSLLQTTCFASYRTVDDTRGLTTALCKLNKKHEDQGDNGDLHSCRQLNKQALNLENPRKTAAFFTSARAQNQRLYDQRLCRRENR